MDYRPYTGCKELVLCDRFGSHMTRQFVEFCEKKLSHTLSHILQPLDVGVFSVYKHWQWGCRGFHNNDWMPQIFSLRWIPTFQLKIRRKISNRIQLGFKLTGLWPVNSYYWWIGVVWLSWQCAATRYTFNNYITKHRVCLLKNRWKARRINLQQSIQSYNSAFQRG